jgi:hypothetical protein
VQIKFFGAALILFFFMTAAFAEYEDLNLLRSTPPGIVSKNYQIISLKNYQLSQGVNPGATAKPITEMKATPLKMGEITPLPLKNDPEIEITPLEAPKEIPKEIPKETRDPNKNNFYFEPGYGRLHFATTQLQRNSYNKMIMRLEPKVGYRIPLGRDVTLDPYLGGELVMLGDQEEYFNHIAPALGLRSKIFKGNADIRSAWGLSLLEDLELYLYTTSYVVLNENGPDPGVVAFAPFKKQGPNNDFVYGFRFFKELKQDHLWQEWYFRLDHRSTDFRSSTYDDWLLFSNGKVGYNFNQNQQGAMEMAPYYGFETFRNFKNK